jgi:hypothetical protein
MRIPIQRDPVLPACLCFVPLPSAAVTDADPAGSLVCLTLELDDITGAARCELRASWIT